jgi:hypothetical protein
MWPLRQLPARLGALVFGYGAFWPEPTRHFCRALYGAGRPGTTHPRPRLFRRCCTGRTGVRVPGGFGTGEPTSGRHTAGHRRRPVWRADRAAGPRPVPINTLGLADPRARLRAEVGGAGYEAVILAVGSIQAAQDGLALLRAKGRLVVFSALPGETPLDLFDVHVRELEIVGACNDQDRLDEAVGRLGVPELALRELITHAFRIEAYQEALDLAAGRHGEALKVAFTFAEER